MLTGIIAFSGVNVFLYNINDIKRRDYLLVNAFLIIVLLFTYVFYELNRLKKQINNVKK